MKRELSGRGRVIATDMSPNAPALYEADAFYLVPKITEPGYIDRVLEICRKEQIQGVFSLIDPNCPCWRNTNRVFGRSVPQSLGLLMNYVSGPWTNGRCTCG